MSRSTRRGFTLAELLVCIGIIAIVMGMFLPAVRKVRGPAERVRCMNNLRQLILALDIYQSNGRSVSNTSAGQPDAPTRQLYPTGYLGPGDLPEDRLSWMVALLPYLEQGTLYQQIDVDKGYSGNCPAAQTNLRMFICAAENEKAVPNAVTHYIAMAGIGLDAAERPSGTVGNGFMGYKRFTSKSMIEDGTANTIALMETRTGLGPWARGGKSNLRGFDPTDLPVHGDHRQFGGHTGSMMAAFADGSTRTISTLIDPKILAAAFTIAGGESVNFD